MTSEEALSKINESAEHNCMKLVPDNDKGVTYALCLTNDDIVVKQISPYYPLRELAIFMEGYAAGLPNKEQESKDEVYLLYEGDEWLSRSSLSLMGIFTNEEDLKKGCEELVRSRAERNYTDSEKEWCDSMEDFIVYCVDELMSNRQVLSSYSSFTISQVATNVMEEI